MGVIAKRSSMIFFSNPVDHYCHRVRIVMAEKDVSVVIKNSNISENLDLLADYNPYNCVPTLVDRDLMLYNSDIIMEYLDERFPHPPLLPVYPVNRSQSRLMMYRIEHDIMKHFDVIISHESNDTQKEHAKKELINQILLISPIFKNMPYFMSEEFSLIDCYLLPLLWRLPYFKISLPAQAKPVIDYSLRLFQRDSFQQSLTDEEREMRS